jgi:hypothetical protein
MASVGLGPAPPREVPASPRLKTASEMVAGGRGQDFLPDLRLSAATFLDYARIPDEVWDFYGTRTSTSNPAIIRIRCPLFAWFGSNEPEIGTAADLDRLKALVARHTEGPSRIDTRIVEGADHLYVGQEAQIAKILTSWIDHLLAADGRG